MERIKEQVREEGEGGSVGGTIIQLTIFDMYACVHSVPWQHTLAGQQ